MKRAHRFDLYTRYDHLPEHLKRYSAPFCKAAAFTWNRRNTVRPDAVAEMLDELIRFIEWDSAADDAEAEAARDLLCHAWSTAARSGEWLSTDAAAGIARLIIQAKDAFVRACLPEPAEGGS